MKITLLLCVLFCGCAQAPIKYSYPELGITIYNASLPDVQNACSLAKFNDSGFAISKSDIICCALVRPHDCVIWASTPDCLTHELAHCAGHKDPQQDGYNWDKGL